MTVIPTQWPLPHSANLAKILRTNADAGPGKEMSFEESCDTEPIATVVTVNEKTEARVQLDCISQPRPVVPCACSLPAA